MFFLRHVFIFMSENSLLANVCIALYLTIKNEIYTTSRVPYVTVGQVSLRFDVLTV